MSKTIEYLFEYKQIKCEEIVDFLIGWLECNTPNSNTIKIDVVAGNVRKMKLDQIKTYLSKKKVGEFDLEQDDYFGFSFSHSEGFNYTQIVIMDYCDSMFNAKNLTMLSDNFLLKRNAFYGDIIDNDYNRIQNRSFPSESKIDHGNLSQVKTYIDEVGRERIDISENPGRRIRKTGLVEAVASTMWLSDTFFELTGADKQKLNELEWLQIEQLSDTVIKITSWPEPFDSAEGEQGRRQIELRKILYPNSKD